MRTRVGWVHSKNWTEERAKFVDKVASLIENTDFRLFPDLVAVFETPDSIHIGWAEWGEDDENETLGIVKGFPKYEPEFKEPTVERFEIKNPTDQQRQEVKAQCAAMNDAYRCGIFLLSGIEVV